MARLLSYSSLILLFSFSFSCNEDANKKEKDISLVKAHEKVEDIEEDVEIHDTIPINKDFYFLKYQKNDSLVMCHNFVKGGLNHEVTIEVKDSELFVSIGEDVIEESFVHCTIQDFNGYGISPKENNHYKIVSGKIQVFNAMGNFELRSNIWVSQSQFEIDTLLCRSIKVSEEHLTFGSNFATVYKVIHTDKKMHFLESSYIRLRDEDKIADFSTKLDNVPITYQKSKATSSTSDYEYEGFVLLN